MARPEEWLIPKKTGGYVSVLPHVKKPNGYCVHKYSFGSKKGMLTKLELFAYFPRSLKEAIIQEAEKLPKAKGRMPPYLHQKGKYKVYYHEVVMWDKAPVEIKAYTQKGGSLKLEVTRGVIKGRGRKFLSPIQTVNSLGSLIKRLTKNAQPIRDEWHTDCFYVDIFLKDCEKRFKKSNLHGQLSLLKKQKLRNKLKFGLRHKQEKHF